MNTYKLYTVSQIITVRNCKDAAHALAKAGFEQSDVWKVEQV